MALTRTRAEIRSDVRRGADIEGTSHLERHPDSDLNVYIDAGYGAFHRKLAEVMPDVRLLLSASASTVSGTSQYTLTTDFSVSNVLAIYSVDMVIDGEKVWLRPFEMHERPMLSDTSVNTTGVPAAYRFRVDTLELLPVPAGVYTVTVWYIPTQSGFANDAATMDTIQRLDDYVTKWAIREVALKDKHWDLHDRMSGRLKELEAEIEFFARSRDVSAPARVTDVYLAHRGRHRRWR